MQRTMLFLRVQSCPWCSYTNGACVSSNSRRAFNYTLREKENNTTLWYIHFLLFCFVDTVCFHLPTLTKSPILCNSSHSNAGAPTGHTLCHKGNFQASKGTFVPFLGLLGPPPAIQLVQVWVDLRRQIEAQKEIGSTAAMNILPFLVSIHPPPCTDHNPILSLSQHPALTEVDNPIACIL